MAKIFNMDDCTWMAADTLDEAWRAYFEFCGYEISTPEGYEVARSDSKDYEPEELSDADLDRLLFHGEHDLGDAGECPKDATCPITFRQRLAQMQAAGETFPCFFATTEC